MGPCGRRLTCVHTTRLMRQEGFMTKKALIIGILGSALVSGGLLASPDPAAADYYRRPGWYGSSRSEIRSDWAEVRRDRQELSRDQAELARDRAALRRLYERGAGRGAIERKKEEIREDLREVRRSQNELRDSYGDLRRDNYAYRDRYRYESGRWPWSWGSGWRWR
jgi:hypothetical protein